jgi:hypothetical protein
VFSNLRKIDLHPSSFAPEGMIPLRDAALTARDAAGADDVPWERILRTLKLHRDTDARH